MEGKKKTGKKRIDATNKGRDKANGKTIERI
jgi:hypothetical protein